MNMYVRYFIADKLSESLAFCFKSIHLIYREKILSSESVKTLIESFEDGQLKTIIPYDM